MSAIWPRSASTAPRVPRKAAPPTAAARATPTRRQPQQPRATQKKGERGFLPATGGEAIGGTGEAANPPPGGGGPPSRGGMGGGGGGAAARGGSGGGPPPAGGPALGGPGGGASGLDWSTVASGAAVTMVAPAPSSPPSNSTPQ